MPETNGSRLNVSLQAGGRQGNGRPFHFIAHSQDDRIRKIFALPDESPLPKVHGETLAVYYDYLVSQFSFPFEALYCQSGGEMRKLIHYVNIVTLVDPRKSRNLSLTGLLCQAQNHKEMLELPLSEFGVREDNPNCQLMDDYAYWFVNHR
jgi:hypothetical protein